MAADGSSGGLLEAYRRRIAELHSRLGIPADYGVARQLSLQPEATELVDAGLSADQRPVRLTPPAAAAWRGLRATAAEAGITLVPLSGFRSVARQSELIQAKLAGGEPMAEVLRFVAAPGFSEHHTGRALDLGVPGKQPLTEAFAETFAYSWLIAQAPTFRFFLSYPRGNPHQLGFEPWHWCYQS